MIEIGDGTNIGRRSTISAANKIVLGCNVLLGPNVFIADTSHEYKYVGIPISQQGITTNQNEVYIGDGTWIGTNSFIAGNLKIGKGCVIGANSIVNRDIPDYCVAVGNPARIVKVLDIALGKWVHIKDEEHLSQVLSEREDLLEYIVPILKLQSLQVEVSSACNLECPQCFSNIPGHKTGMLKKELWDEKIKPVLPQLRDIYLVGIGEPLLCKDFFYFVGDSVKNNVKVHTTSNLQLVDEGIAEKLVTSGIEELSFSCDGATKETYEKIRVNGSFEKLKENLRLINKYKQLYQSTTPRLILNFGGLKANIVELPLIVKLAKEFNISSIIAYHDVIYVDKLKEESLYHYQQLSDENFFEAKLLADKMGIDMFLPGLFSEPIKHNAKGIYCSYPYAHLWIYSDGRVGPCCMDFPDRFVLGDLKEATLEEVWNSKPILNLRKQLTTAPSYTCKYCTMHGKMDISDCRYFFRFEGYGEYIKCLQK
jgi:radical SAM protein with 4Fe4S-binding SPASM domain